eukprot:Skav221140  [mRNA]  locus=scaffold3794:80566:89708:- [translate_table: standard]
MDNCKPCGGAIPLCMIDEFDLPRDIVDRQAKGHHLVLDLLQKVFYTSDAARESFVELCEEEYVQKAINVDSWNKQMETQMFDCGGNCLFGHLTKRLLKHEKTTVVGLHTHVHISTTMSSHLYYEIISLALIVFRCFQTLEQFTALTRSPSILTCTRPSKATIPSAT